METQPIKIKAKIDAQILFSFLLRHTYTSLSGIVGLIISAVAFVFFFISLNGSNDFQKVILLLAALLYTVINPYMLYMKAKAQSVTNPLYKETLVYTLDDAGVHLTVNGKEESLEWSMIEKWRKTRKVCILYTSKIHAILLPYGAMNGRREQVESLIKEKLNQSMI